MSSLLLLITEALVIYSWKGQYTRSGREMSELAVPRDNSFDAQLWSLLMTITFVWVFVAIAIGALLWVKCLVLPWQVAVLYVLGTCGGLILALSPLNFNAAVHGIGANLLFVSWTTAVLQTSLQHSMGSWLSPLRWLVIAFASLALISLCLHSAQVWWPVDKGAIQRGMTYSAIAAVCLSSFALYRSARTREGTG